MIVLGAIQDLGQGDPTLGYKRMLAAAVVAGGLQIGFYLLRLGNLGVGVPSSVIHGMLTAIGIIIMTKQIHVGLGVVPHHKETLGLIGEIPASLHAINPEVALITVTGLFLILVFQGFKGKWAKFFPAPLAVVAVGMYLGRLFDFDHVHLVQSHWMTFEVGPKLLLNLPESISSAIVFPDFSQVFTFTSLRWAVALALVASIESLLSSAAVDRMDPYRRRSNLDRELLGKGVCNMLCGLIGGLPIIAEIVRSSANVRNGARTHWANFFHGFFILSFLVLLPHVLHEIPLAALAALLISVGYRLAHPAQFFHVAAVGRGHFAAFMVTLLVTLASDLLIGVATGLVVEIAVNLFHGAPIGDLFRVRSDEEEGDGEVIVRIQSPLVFTNLLPLKKLVTRNHRRLVLDLSGSPVVDSTVAEHLHQLQDEYCNSGREVIISYSEEHRAVSSHPHASRKRRTKVS